MKQYPHYLYIRVVGASVQDGEGNWTTPSDSWVLHSACREETNGKGSVINSQDGKSILFSSTVYLPKIAPRVNEGTEVQVRESIEATGFVRIQKTILKFENGQLNCKVWL